MDWNRDVMARVEKEAAGKNTVAAPQSGMVDFLWPVKLPAQPPGGVSFLQPWSF